MCTHASSGKEITEKLSQDLYPYIDFHILEVVEYLKQAVICNEATVLFDLFYRVKKEFESLKDYNTKLVFPSVLRQFDTKHKPGEREYVNINELQQFTLKKEQALMHLIADIEQEAEFLHLPDNHPIFRLISAFRTRFADDKKEWNAMLLNWNNTCACFATANHSGMNKKSNALEHIH